MALTTTPKPAGYARSIGMTSAPLLHGEEKAAQTYIVGAMLQDDDAGRMTESTSPIDASAVGKRAFGIALRAASGTTDADVPFVLLGRMAVLEVTLSNATAGTHTLAQTNKWKVYPLTKSTHWYADANAVSDTGGLLIIEFVDPIGTVDGRVRGILTSPAIGGVNAGSAAF